MKKHLLATSAIAVATGLAALSSPADAAERLKLGLGGYFQAYVGYFDADDNSTAIAGSRRYRDFDFFKEAEIHFNGEVALDNGMKVGIDVQLEAETCGDQIDESYLYFQGDFGKLVLGSENSAAYLMSYGAPAVDSSFDGADPNYGLGPLSDTFGNSTLPYVPNITSDSEKITYFTPRFAGFGFGASYTPDNTEDGGAGSSVPGRKDDGTGSQAGQGDVVELGLNYENKFGDFGVLAGLTYGRATRVEDRANVANTNERRNWSAGLNLTYAGFTVGGGWFWDNNGRDNDGDVEAWAAGVAWANGPLRIGASWLDYEIELESVGGTYSISRPGQDADITRWGLGGSYQYAPGMQFRLSGFYYDWDGPNDDLFMVVAGTIISF